ncbi:ABC transporter substrate-binding protein [Rhodopila sp.]|jgi:NitT/TauT family transport system substrate-binding protein|uniref:ABC transporter substrate-binding protein n=1 Tax=Rhodopila sp. TaxID=2480087 RepID=UPI002D0C6104|nr:ABC transporter substrate-binding protein [Rhodopila sp.]HVZ07426.1 ABC transporter substrate-binding protein [Rhodopila sp.]
MIILSENFRALFYTPFYAAHAIGAYRAEGVDVRLRESSSPERTAAALNAGDVDVMWGGPLRVLLQHDADPASDIVCFCDVVARDPFFVIGRAPRPDFRPADLTKVRLATVSEVPTPWLCLQDDIRRDGADPALVPRIAGGTMAGNAQALRDGAVDAVQLFQPYAEELLASGAGHLWYAAASRGLTAYTTLNTRRSVIATRRDELLAMVRGMRRTLRWIRATPGAGIARTLHGYFPDLSPALFAAAIDRYKALDLYGPDPLIRREGFDRLVAAMRSGGALKRDIPFSACVDTSLAEEALASGG